MVDCLSLLESWRAKVCEWKLISIELSTFQNYRNKNIDWRNDFTNKKLRWLEIKQEKCWVPRFHRSFRFQSIFLSNAIILLSSEKLIKLKFDGSLTFYRESFQSRGGNYIRLFSWINVDDNRRKQVSVRFCFRLPEGSISIEAEMGSDLFIDG